MPEHKGNSRVRAGEIAALVAIVALALWLRLPQIGYALPYFYQEDEGHHFNRLVEMVKAGSFDPDYFNKPSLHFYLRMPVVAAAFVWSVKEGEVRRLEEVRTRDPQGLGRWAWSASHPRLVVWNRAFTLVLSLLVVVMAWLLAGELTGSSVLRAGAALLTAVSPPLVADSAKIGVDTLMVLMCLVSIWLAMRLATRFTPRLLLLAGLGAGLAVSSKYNAAPVAVVPLAACLAARRFSPGVIAAALALPVAGFFLGTPFALVSIPQFLENMAYEAWHYGTAGHGGATGEPGLGQAVFYLRWLGASGIGYGATALGLVGTVLLAWRRRAGAAVFLVFPVLFFLLMIIQKVNFTRNVLVFVPVMAVAATAGALDGLARSGRWWLRVPGVRAALALVLFVSLQPFAGALGQKAEVVSAPPDTREVAEGWLAATRSADMETALAADLQFAPSIEKVPYTAIVGADDLDPERLYLEGFDRLVVGTESAESVSGSPFVQKELAFQGIPGRQRIVVSPEITVFRLVPAGEPEQGGPASSQDEAVRRAVSAGEQPVEGGRAAVACDGAGGGARGHPGGEPCRIGLRAARVVLDGGIVSSAAASGPESILEFDLMSPWRDQSCSFGVGGWRSPNLCAGLEPGTWHELSIRVPAGALAEAGGFETTARQVHAWSEGGGARVAFGLRNLRLRKTER